MTLFSLDNSTILVRRVPENPKVKAVWHVLPDGRENLCYCRTIFPAYEASERRTAKDIEKGDKFCAFCFPKHFTYVKLESDKQEEND